MHNYSQQQKTVSVVGARGYSGLELVRLLLKHPSVRLSQCYASQEFRLADDLLDSGVDSIPCLPESQLFEHPTDFVFLATPPEVSTRLAPKLVAAGRTVIDLSHAFRASADYGLVPFCGPKAPETNLIANPGCYATAIAMALIPLLKAGVMDVSGICIDAKSGTTGAGRKASESQLFSEVDGECLPYRIGQHQHLPEILKAVQVHAGASIDPHFVTHLVPYKRGITAGIYATAKSERVEAITEAYAAHFTSYPLVRFGAGDARLLKMKNVVGTPYVHLSYSLVGHKLYLFSAIDNLFKGAASQAIENLNRCLDLPPGFSLQ